MVGLSPQTQCLFECGFLPLGPLPERRIAAASCARSLLLTVTFRAIRRWRVTYAPSMCAEFADSRLVGAATTRFLTAAHEPVVFADLKAGMTVRAATGMAKIEAVFPLTYPTAVYRPIWRDEQSECFLLTDAGPLVSVD